MEEIFKDIPGFEKYYQVSTRGRVKAKARDTVFKDGRVMHYEEHFMNLIIDNTGYYVVRLQSSQENINRKIEVHRIMALAFLGECPDGYTVDHINRNKLDNRIENLRYATWSEQNLNQDKTKTKMRKGFDCAAYDPVEESILCAPSCTMIKNIPGYSYMPYKKRKRRENTKIFYVNGIQMN